ncbi:GAF domain-containing protein [Sphingomonas hankyongi]|uniref:GAF domain-containing protein n=1 Tax=Sphingomonas hankyongi TaxID=2908209 RepID=A0ABT0RZV1_9SPHN|nr:GAF domain-containing protein [Sphingomonas hankyongi]MCL6729138.1 GAF domain-containing protein [Sphingomonas hankyongi]
MSDWRTPLLYGGVMLEQMSPRHRDHERERLQLMFEHAPGFMLLVEGPSHRIAIANRAFSNMVGGRELAGKILSDGLPEFIEQGVDEILDGVTRSGEAFVAQGMPLAVERSDGSMEEILADVVFQPIPPSEGHPAGVFIQGQNVTDDKRSQALRTAHSKVLELAIGDSPLEETLSALIDIVESSSSTGVMGSILLLDPDGKHLRHGAAPSLPKTYMKAIDGAEIGACCGSCGTAAYLGAAVFVSDIATDPLWADYKQLALPHGLRACWSIPILTRGRKVLGTFAMYHREPREPTIRDLLLVDLITQTAALVIDRDRALRELQHIRLGQASGQSSSSS